MLHPVGTPQIQTTRDAAEAQCPPAGQRFPRLGPLIEYLDSLNSRADLNVLSRLLVGLDLTRADIAPSCIFGIKGYRRNTISSSPWYELLALCWRSGDRTPIHDHAGVSCAFRVIEGQGSEIRFEKTPSGLICPSGTVKMNPGYICAANDADIHQVANMQAPSTDLVTLHIYSPPIKKMNTYEFSAPVPPECAGQYASGEDLPC